MRDKEELDPSDPLTVHLLQIMRDLRNQRKITQEALAEKAGIDRRHVARLEAGESSPILGTIHRVAQALDVRLSVLIAQAERKISEDK